MRVGIALPIDSSTEPTGDVISRDARAAEEHGFDSVWFFDSVGRGGMSLDPLIGVSVAAAATKGIEVGIGILQVPLRHPVELAHRIMTAQLICEGQDGVLKQPLIEPVSTCLALFECNCRRGPKLPAT